MENNEDIKNAKQELDKISQDDILRRMALKAELERMDQKQLNYEARRDGKAEAKKEDAKKMLEENIPIETIMKVTGLSKEEILN